MKIPKEVLERFRHFCKKDIELFVRKGLIKCKFDAEDLRVLEIISKIWAKRVFIKRQMIWFTYKERLKLIETCHFSKLDTYIYSRIKEFWEKGERIDIDMLTYEVMARFNIKPTKSAFEMIKKKIVNLRKYAGLIRKKKKKLQVPEKAKKKKKLEILKSLEKPEIDEYEVYIYDD